ncbi:PEP/pyruvate-binding domain-containing protein [Raineyella sp. W15-4]|uniref:PEP/pyruvate-binding domain-containing protein n=1 Tax=Raineyella sp. W15-4 TaxID=3081651 RepID=UPI002954B66D|nr:PEP/pyruvate-binding domain-containing protein [Raineyella sp. W15-4]WOQ17816.1 PEP/pyruvate-binding domain-containing protein [Raineyella sp. W15-4]
MTGYVLGFEQLDATMIAVAGGKGANLGELSRIDGVRVPEGFCITTDAHTDAVAGDPALAALLEGLSRLGADDTKGIGGAVSTAPTGTWSCSDPDVMQLSGTGRTGPPVVSPTDGTLDP